MAEIDLWVTWHAYIDSWHILSFETMLLCCQFQFSYSSFSGLEHGFGLSILNAPGITIKLCGLHFMPTRQQVNSNEIPTDKKFFPVYILYISDIHMDAITSLYYKLLYFVGQEVSRRHNSATFAQILSRRFVLWRFEDTPILVHTRGVRPEWVSFRGPKTCEWVWISAKNVLMGHNSNT